MGHLDLLAALDAPPTHTAKHAAIFLPTRTCFEANGAFVNNEGRLQAFAQVLEPGLPLRDASPAGHPPREFSPDTLGDEPWPAWRILARLLGQTEDLGELRRALAGAGQHLAALADLTPDTPGIRLSREVTA
jgi:NADH-quinone oxidoreductase subunit G